MTRVALLLNHTSDENLGPSIQKVRETIQEIRLFFRGDSLEVIPIALISENLSQEEQENQRKASTLKLYSYLSGTPLKELLPGKAILNDKKIINQTIHDVQAHFIARFKNRKILLQAI